MEGRMTGTAWAAASHMQQGVFSPSQRAEINRIAHASAASELCPTLTIDPEALRRHTSTLIDAGPADAKLKGRTPWEQLALYHLGVQTGLMLSDGDDRLEAFCAESTADANAGLIADLLRVSR